MWNRKTEIKHTAVINNTDRYIIINLTFNTKTNLFTLHNYQEINALHGEYGSQYFINHTLFFNTITRNAVGRQKGCTAIALLFSEPFIVQKPSFVIPTFSQEQYTIAHPLLLQCAIIPRTHNIVINTITETNAAYDAAISYTKHPHDEYSFSRLFTKKNSNDYVPHEQYYNAIAASGSYLMEYA